MSIPWLLVNGAIDEFQSWSGYGNRGGVKWDFTHLFYSVMSSSFFQALYPYISTHINTAYYSDVDTLVAPGINYCGLDCMFIPNICGIVVSWLVSMISCMQLLLDNCSHFCHATIWVPSNYSTFHQSVISDNLSEGWMHHIINSIVQCLVIVFAHYVHISHYERVYPVKMIHMILLYH